MEIYSCKIEKNIKLNEIENRLIEKLKEKGFGLVTKFSLSDVFKNKLNKNIGEYIILGVCNPSYSYEIYSIDQSLGGILPCKITIFTEENKNYIGIIKPTVQNDFLDNDKFKNILKEVENILINIIKNI